MLHVGMNIEDKAKLFCRGAARPQAEGPVRNLRRDARG
jgi:hypothetical protein